MQHDCKCKFNTLPPAQDVACPVHPRCACGCLRSAHAFDGIGECKTPDSPPKACHGCPEYRPAKYRRFLELDDEQLDKLDGEALRAEYRAFRAHHIEETTVLFARAREFPVGQKGDKWSLHDDTHMLMLSNRDISMDDMCKPCAGFGVRLYSHGSTWRGGMGTNGFVHDICDECWGSGNRERPWRNLRTLEADIREQVAVAAVEALARSVGATFQSESTKGSVRQVITHLNNMQHKKKIGNELMSGIWTGPLANGLANLLRRALGDPEIDYEQEWKKGRKAFR